MSHSNLPEITKYPHLAKMELYKNQAFVSLLLNTPNIELENEQTEDNYDSSVLTFDYVDGLVTEQKSFVCIDTIINQSSPTINDVRLTIFVGVSKPLMKIDTTFKRIGNRRDNLIREIDYTLRGNSNFGIGGLELIGSIKPVTIPQKDFSCKTMTYKVPCFNTK